MSNIPTCAVRSTVRDSVGGQPVAGATITARLSSYELYEGFVVPRDIITKSDANGEFVLNLFPNELGAAASFYDIKIISPTGKSLRTIATVPHQATVDLADISDVPPYDGKINVTMQQLDSARGAVEVLAEGAAESSAAALVAAGIAGDKAELSDQRALAAAADRAAAEIARAGAEVARDGALIAAGNYPNELEGRLASADGQAYKVQVTNQQNQKGGKMPQQEQQGSQQHQKAGQQNQQQGDQQNQKGKQPDQQRHPDSKQQR